MLQEWNQRGRDGGDLVGRHVHVLKLFRLHNREVAFQACLHSFVFERTVVFDRGVRLGDQCAVLLFGRQVHNAVLVGGSLASLDLAVRGFNEAQTVHLGVHTQA